MKLPEAIRKRELLVKRTSKLAITAAHPHRHTSLRNICNQIRILVILSHRGGASARRSHQSICNPHFHPDTL